MKYRFSFVKGGSGYEREDYIYLDTDTEITKRYGTYGRGKVSSLITEEAPKWVNRILGIPGVLSVSLRSYVIQISHAPLFEEKGIIRKVVPILKSEFSKGQPMIRFRTTNEIRRLCLKISNICSA